MHYFLCNYSPDLVFPLQITHTHTLQYSAGVSVWFYQSKSMCVSVAVLSSTGLGVCVQHWELARWSQQMGRFFSVLWDHRACCPPHCSRWPREPSLSVKNSPRWFRVFTHFLTQIERKCGGNCTSWHCTALLIIYNQCETWPFYFHKVFQSKKGP